MDNNSVSMKFNNEVTNQTALEDYLETLILLEDIISAFPELPKFDFTGSTSGLTTVKNDLTDITSKSDIEVNMETNGVEEVAKETEEISENLTVASTEATNLGDNISKVDTTTLLQGLIAIKAVISAISSVINTFSDSITEASAYTESVNLLEVAFGDASDEAKNFINTFSDMYMLDESNVTSTVALFKQLATAMGMADEAGTQMSTTLAQVGLDMASLYNTDYETAITALESALSGQTESIRQFGVDITDVSLQEFIDTEGLNLAIDDLTYAEKRMVIVMQTMSSLQNIQGDYGNTSESLANQLKALSENFTSLTRSIGNVLYPVLQAVLPYLNAIVMVVTEIINAIAKLIGYDINDYVNVDVDTSGIDDITDSFDGVADSSDNASNSLRSFDKLNNMTTSVVSSSGASITATDNALIDSYNDMMAEYESNIESITTKANILRDTILEWLGFSKQVNEETGEIYFTFEKITGGTILGALATGGAIYLGVSAISGFLAKIGVIGAKLPSIFAIATSAIAALKLAIAPLIASIMLDYYVGGLTAVLTGLAATAAPVAIAIAAIAAVVGTLVWGFSDAVDEVEIFDDTISEATKNAVEPFIEELDSLDETIKNIDITGIMTDEDLENLENNLSAVTSTIKDDYLEDLEEITEDIMNLDLYPSLTTAQRNEILSSAEEVNEERIKQLEDAENEILKIYQNAYDEQRELTESENNAISGLQQELLETGIQTLSENAEEQRTILTKISEQAHEITLEQYSDLLQQAVQNKNDMIAEAESQYEEEISLANQLYYDLGSISEDEYKNLLSQAEQNKEDQIKEAENTYSGIYDSAVENYGDVALYIDEENGEILNNFQVWGNKISDWWGDLWEGLKTKWNEFSTWITTKWNELGETLGNLWDNVSSNFAENLQLSVNTILGDLEAKINSYLIDPINSVLKYINGIEILGWSPDFDLFNDITVPRLKTGIDFVPNDYYGPVYLDYGERVLTKEENESYSSGAAISAVESYSSNNGTSDNQVINLTVQVGSKEIGKTVLKELNSLAKTNGKVITIGG